MTEITTQPTAEEIARHYSAAMDSVNLINAGQPERMSDEDWADTVARNVDHLRIMVAKDFMQDQDLAPLQAAIASHD
jgi:dihydrodipicolinate synthase/N-acetylneuraminate lyase